jgi:hypothetical protein
MGRAILVGLAAAGLLAGCGGGASTIPSTSSATSTTAAHETPTITEPGAETGSLAEVKRRLSAAGYSPEERTVTGNAVQDVEVDGIEIDSYRTTAAADAEYRAMQILFRKNAGRGIARRVGTTLYWFAEERSLTPDERARFEKVVRIAEGA